MQETQVHFLGQEDPLEKELAMHSSILAWKIPWTKEPVNYSPQGRKEMGTTERRHFICFICLPKWSRSVVFDSLQTHGL